MVISILYLDVLFLFVSIDVEVQSSMAKTQSAKWRVELLRVRHSPNRCRL